MSQEALHREKQLKKARWYSDRNRTYKACVLYLDVLRQDPGNVFALEELAQIYLERGDSSLASICYRWLCQQFPDRQELFLRHAQSEFSAGNFHSARLILASAGSFLPPLEEEALMAKSQVEAALSHELEAILWLNQLIEKYPNAIYYMVLAEMLEQLGLTHCAMEACRRGLKREPYQDELLSLKARLHLGLSEYSQARKIYLKMIKNHLFLEDARMDLEDFIDERGPVPAVVEILRFFDEGPQ